MYAPCLLSHVFSLPSLQFTNKFDSLHHDSYSPAFDPDDWTPFESRAAFKLANFLYQRVQMFQGNIDELMDYWAETLLEHGGSPPFADHQDLLSTINQIPHSDAPWQCFTEKIDYAPYREYTQKGTHRYQQLMSGNWTENPNNKGCMFTPIILGSDKTTISVATGQNEYYPLYIHSKEHPDILVDEFMEMPKVVWEEYGYVIKVTPFTDGFPHANIHELITPDLLHQVIKGTFKDHIVTWILEYLKIIHGEACANQIIDNIDHCITAALLFPGHHFKQWTGDDSKALMKVILPTIAGHVPPQMVHCLADFMEFCYFTCRDVFDTDVLDQLEAALKSFHQNLKQPWQRTNKYEALGQMLLINQRQDKLAAAYDYYKKHACKDTGLRIPTSSCISAIRAGLRFLFGQLYPHDPCPLHSVPVQELPPLSGSQCLRIFHSATAKFYAPSDISNINGMHCECIHAIPHCDLHRNGEHVSFVIHIDTILHGAHLIPVFRQGFLPNDFHYSYSLDCFRSYYVNKYADHHMHEIAY
ncbi:hypothetical protein K474DRAFT_1686266 [Panus rudis PR-1116 ss-1]|nr:hypothetical protein K474DRAFT_1686266 [Panus rudis PR-1116 ss-1]